MEAGTPEGCVAVLPGYTLERATCGLVRATRHKGVRLLVMQHHQCFRNQLPMLIGRHSPKHTGKTTYLAHTCVVGNLPS